MYVYDFDKTIYAGDSSIDFYFYTVRKHPCTLRFLPKQLHGFVLYALKKISKRELKSRFFSFLSAIDSENLANTFWKENADKIYPWYLNQQRPNDIIISASPEFLLKPICNMLGINCLIASDVDVKNGNFISENCYGQEKVDRLIKAYGPICIDSFYSDSLSDAPLASLAKQAYLIKNGKIMKWPT